MFFRTFFFFVGGGQISRITQTSWTADPQLTPKNKGHGLRCQCSTEALADGSLKKVWGDSRVLVFFLRKLLSWFGGVNCWGWCSARMSPLFFSRSRFQSLFFWGGILMFWVVLFFSVCIFELQSLPVSWLIFGKNVPRPGKATSDYSDMWGGGFVGRRDMCCLCRTFEEMQADSPIDLISRELLLSSLHPGVSCFEGAQKGGKCGMPALFFF